LCRDTFEVIVDGKELRVQGDGEAEAEEEEEEEEEEEMEETGEEEEADAAGAAGSPDTDAEDADADDPLMLDEDDGEKTDVSDNEEDEKDSRLLLRDDGVDGEVDEPESEAAAAADDDADDEEEDMLLLLDDEAVATQEEDEEQEEEEGPPKEPATAEMARKPDIDHDDPVTLGGEDESEDDEDEPVSFHGVITDQHTGRPLSMCEKGFSLTRTYRATAAAAAASTDDRAQQQAEVGKKPPPPLIQAGDRWTGSYECAGTPTSATLHVLEATPRQTKQTKQQRRGRGQSPPPPPQQLYVRANFSFTAVTATGGFRLRVPPQPLHWLLQADEPSGRSLRLSEPPPRPGEKLFPLGGPAGGGGGRAGGETSGSGGGGRQQQGYTATRNEAQRRQAAAQQSAPEEWEEAEDGVWEPNLPPPTLTLHQRLDLAARTPRGSDSTRPPPFPLDARDTRIETVLRSVERLYNSTRQVPRTLSGRFCQLSGAFLSVERGVFVG
jgi:hypothetical protein